MGLGLDLSLDLDWDLDGDWDPHLDLHLELDSDPHLDLCFHLHLERASFAKDGGGTSEPAAAPLGAQSTPSQGCSLLTLPRAAWGALESAAAVARAPDLNHGRDKMAAILLVPWLLLSSGAERAPRRS